MALPRRSLLKTTGATLLGGALLGTAATASADPEFEDGQRVATTANLVVHTWASLSAPDRWVAPNGSAGYLRDGPVSRDGYTWWKVGFNAGYEGWCVREYLEPAPIDGGGGSDGGDDGGSDGGDDGGSDGGDDGGSDGGDGGSTGERTIEGSVPAGGRKAYTHDPSSGVEKLTLKLTGPDDADLDLYATLDGRTPSFKDFDERSWNYGSEESIAVAGSEVGDEVGVLVDAYSGGGGFTLTITETGVDDGGDDGDGGGDGGDGGDDGGTDGRFDLGERVATTADLVIHAEPSLSAPDAWVAPDGSAGYVREGPRTADGYTWWEVEFNSGERGWCVQAYLESAPYDGDPAPSAEFVWPVGGEVTSGYYDDRVRDGRRVNHKAIDIAASSGTPIVAARSGTVSVSTTFPSGGKAVFLAHEDGYRTEYHHMSSRAVSEGESVSRGEVIGYVGSTGHSTGPHLHFELVHDDRNLVVPGSDGDSVTKGDPIEKDFPELE